jgi:hypothetical protein
LGHRGEIYLRFVDLNALSALNANSYHKAC